VAEQGRIARRWRQRPETRDRVFDSREDDLVVLGVELPDARRFLDLSVRRLARAQARFARRTNSACDSLFVGSVLVFEARGSQPAATTAAASRGTSAA
jgi:hypothetical protein